MIVADRKSLDEIQDMVKNYQKVMILGCKGCVTVCNVGGLKEVQILSSTLKIARRQMGQELEVGEHIIERQCDPEYINQIKEDVEDYDAILSMACGVGPQFLSEAYPNKRFMPAVNTTFFGGAVAHGIWEERCAGCGSCVTHYFDGMCPIARCSKSIMHGPCGGSTKGKCEIDTELICIWDKIIEKKAAEGRLDDLSLCCPPKDWRTGRDGGPRKSIREELVE